MIIESLIREIVKEIILSSADEIIIMLNERLGNGPSKRKPQEEEKTTQTVAEKSDIELPKPTPDDMKLATPTPEDVVNPFNSKIEFTEYVTKKYMELEQREKGLGASKVQTIMSELGQNNVNKIPEDKWQTVKEYLDAV
jgi:hypothetical protein